ncbi:hypothetical protein BGX34_004786 [Mortierella sp. NVP85]|nr:hypothetical protein BGX34_004786 [Mortierella sp. NVP85]
MVTTQSFRLLGKPDIKDIICGQVEGDNVIIWEDIEQVFPGVNYIVNGNTVISMMRDSNRNRIMPQCIKHYPGAILDVVLPITPGDNPLELPTKGSSVSHTEERPSAPNMTLDLETEIVQRLASSLTPRILTQLRTASNGYDLVMQAVKDGQVDPSDIVKRCLHELKTEMIKNTELSTRVIELIRQKELKDQPINQMDQIPLIRERIQSILSRNYKLYENPIPRLFIVLPMVHPSSWNSQDPFSNASRLYFLCDCGEHTMSTNSRTSHRVHLANHEGYDITRPKEFFRQYGHYVLTILQMLKFGISMAGTTVPALPKLIETKSNDQSPTSLRFLEESIEFSIDLIMEYVGKSTAQLDSNEAPESVDLRQLETFLKTNNQSRVLGNLYRTVTLEGHVKWVCINHYRENHPETAAMKFRDTVRSLKGLFDEHLGRAEVLLESRDEADQFHLALEKAKAIYELKIDLDWSTTQSDFMRLRDILMKTNVGVLELDLNFQGGPDSDTSNRPKRHDPIFDIMRQTSIQSVTLIQPPKDFVQRSTLLTHTDDFSNLKHLDLDFTQLDSDIPGFRKLIGKAPNLSSLVMQGTRWMFLDELEAVLEYQTYPITFKIPEFRLLPPTSESPQPTITIRDIVDMLKALGGRIEQVELNNKGLQAPALAAFANATEDGSRLKELTLCNADRHLGEQSIKDLSSVVARSELRKLDINLEGEEERVNILESIQWRNICDLTITMDERSHGMKPLKIVVDEIEKLLGGTQMDRFVLRYSNSRPNLPSAQEQLLRSFVASTSLKHLRLDVPMSLQQVLSIIGSANLSQIQSINLQANDFNTDDVKLVLNSLGHATELRAIVLGGASIGDQIELMAEKGIALRNK